MRKYGRFSGGIVNVVTKSGTNNIHGSVYRVSCATRNWTPAAISIRKEECFKRNQFGGTIAPPCVKNKLFFLATIRVRAKSRNLSKSSRPLRA